MSNEESSLSNDYLEIFSILGISRKKFAPIELQYINKWTNDYEFTLDVILEACKKAVSIGRNVSFSYIDGILRHWYQNNLKSLEEIEKYTESRKDDSKSGQKVGHHTTNDRSSNKVDHSEIKRCPFCGATASLSANYSNRFETWFINVMCEECGSQGKTYTSNDHPENYNWDNDSCKNAINAWNKRV
ncbi:MAG: DnaD domain protein [Eubacterium sp.]|jgi:DnaD and phage-associated domain|nr:DnaD domain protein [Eubacterium sp.]